MGPELNWKTEQLQFFTTEFFENDRKVTKINKSNNMILDFN